ncbi:hypothetical protein LCGC14_0613970 [marine sediment metagenome]|uniref:Uncharacterized protein n=1 Tax=marine sediment metagenome TaxID=412755 RepID=A0A0F9RR66_9ZZZZ
MLNLMCEDLGGNLLTMEGCVDCKVNICIASYERFFTCLECGCVLCAACHTLTDCDRCRQRAYQARQQRPLDNSVLTRLKKYIFGKEEKA